MSVRDPRPDDEADFRRLWGEYLTFYRKDLPEGVTAHTWARILDPASPVFARLVEKEGAVVGFAVCVVHEGTWHVQPLCYLEDLFVDPDARGSGCGRALIDDLIALARARGWPKVYWHTETGNARARRLYDQYGPADDYVRYTVLTG